MLRFINRQCGSRKLMVFSICFLFGIISADCGFPDFRITAALLIFSIFAILIAARKSARSTALLMIIPAFLLGSMRMYVAIDAHDPVPDLFSIEFSGRVIDEPIFKSETERIICAFELDTLDGISCSDTVRLYIRSDVLPLEGIEYGQHLYCSGHVWPGDPATNPYQFDSEKWLRSIGMNGMAAAKLEDIRVETCENTDLNHIIIQLRRVISDRIGILFPKNADLVRAFVLGDRSGLDDDLRGAFNKTGVAHLIAISGMHISVLAMAVSNLLRRFLHRNTAILATIAMVILYGMLIGFPASLIRATIMFAVFNLGPVFGRPSDSMTRISFALLLMLLVNPFYIYSSGFVLSFSASAGIILLEPPISTLFHVDCLKHKKPRPTLPGRLLQKLAVYVPTLFCTTLAAQIATLPAITAYFGAQSQLSIPVNLLAIPLAMAAYPIALIVLLISVVSAPLGVFAASVPETMFTALIRLIQMFSSVHGVTYRIPRYPAWLLLIHCCGILCASELCGISPKKRHLLPVFIAGLTIVSLGCSWISSMPFRIVFLDAGQADAAILRTDGRNYLFDVGDVYTPAADYASAACPSVDAVFLSHPHYDHAGGLSALLEAVKPGTIYVPEGWFDVEASATVSEGISLAKKLGIPIVELHPGDCLDLSGNTSLTVHETEGNSINDMSMLLEVRYFDTGILFTGDLTTEGEPDMIPDVDILKVPHHGSSKASSARLIESTSPSISIISVGDNNYGHPADSTIERLTQADSEVYRTDQCGAITAYVLPNGRIITDTYLTMEDIS